MQSPSALPKIPAVVQINQAILEYSIIAARRHNAEIDAFVNGATSTSTLILEVFKGLIASHNV